MSRSLIKFLYFTSIVLFTACSKDESPFLTKEQAEKEIKDINTSRDPFHYVNDVVAIINNDIYYFSSLDSLPKRLTNTPSAVKTQVKLSHDKSQIAYINAAGNPVIIHADNGATITTLTQYNYIDQMDWAKDRLTLYMLSGNQVSFYGNAPVIQQPEITHPYDDVKSFSMNALGDQGYYIKNYGDFWAHMEYHSTSKGMDTQYTNFDGDIYDYVDFYDNRGNFLVGITDSYSGGMEKIACIQNYQFYPAYTWDDELMNTPTFNASTEVLLYGTLESTPYKLKAVYLGTDLYQSSGSYDVLSKVLDDYPSSTKIYVDWVQ